MNMATKRNIFEEHLTRWLKAKGNKQKRGEITTHICFVTGIHRNSVPRAFKRLQLRDPLIEDKRGRATYYTPDVTAALKDVWEAGDEACGELLHPEIPEYVAALIRDGLWTHSTEATTKLLAMSERTIKRRVCAFERSRGFGKGISATKPSELKAIIPIFKGPWKDLPPGHMQIDTVAHCGSTLLGDFVFSLSAIDAATYWTSTRAQWNKGQEATVASMQSINETLPFVWREAHPDTGSEFINWHCKQWCDTEDIAMSRSEPGKKNDNMYVEERNNHIVRRYFGYRRFDCPLVVPLMNEFYRVQGLYSNHFKAVRRQVSRERVGSKYVRRYEKVAKTPYQRVLEHTAVEESVKEKLRAEHATLNPLTLKREMDRLLEMVNNQQTRHDHRLCGCTFR
jgi:hypothetical protein